MKYINSIKSYLFLILGVSLVFSCSEDNILGEDGTPPGQVKEISISATHGGAVITYTLPNDDDIQYVKVTYKDSFDKTKFSVCSPFDNELVIEGLNDTESHTGVIEVVDLAGNTSTPLEIRFTPLMSHIQLIKENIEMSATFGGVSLQWYNQEMKTTYVNVIYNDDFGNEVSRFVSSDQENARAIIRGFNTDARTFSVQIEDYFGNKTEVIQMGEFSPLFEVEIPKDTWELNEVLSVNGNAWEGQTVNVFDGVVDTKENNNDNSYAIITRDNNGGSLSFPLDLVIDLQQEIVMNRLMMWQRAYWYGNDENYFYYQNENVKAFEIYTSNDLLEWKFAGSFDLGDPKDEDGNVPEEAILEAINGHEFILDVPTEKFRYLKFSITENYGSEEIVNLSEISIFGSYGE